MIANIVEQILSKADKSVKSWADSKEYSEGLILYPNDGGPAVEVNGRTIIDGLESFAEFNLKHEDAKFRDVARKISREQYGAIKLNKKVVSAIVQHGAFGEEIF